MFPAVHTTTHRGIPVRWADLPGPITGTLIFGVGHRDEPAHLMGITHLIEHLAFRTIEPLHVQSSGVVSDESLMFYATGEPDDVARFLNDISRALHSIGNVSSEDLDLEKTVLRTEAGTDNSTAGLLTYRFGLGGLGNSNASHAGSYALTATELAAWSSDWMTSSNAALTFTGPIPAALALDLPTGKPPQRWSGQPVDATPRLVESGKVGVAVSLVVDWESALELGRALSEEARRRLRHDLGLIYSPEVFHTRIDEKKTQLDLILDPNGENVPQVLDETLKLLRRLVVDGFSESVVVTTRTAGLTELAWVNSVAARHLDDACVADLLGFPTSAPAVELARAESVTSERLTAALVDALDSLVLSFDEDEPPTNDWIAASGLPLDRFDVWDEGLASGLPARPGRTWRGKVRGDMAKYRATVSDGLVVTRSRLGDSAIRLDDLVMLGRRGCGCLQLVDFRGRCARIDPDDWYRGKSLAAAIIASVNPEIVRALPSH